MQIAFDREKAKQTFQEALDAISRLPEPDNQSLLEPARMAAAAVAPELVSEFPASSPLRLRLQSENLAHIMLEHGNVDATVAYLMSCDEASRFPFGTVSALMPRVSDEDTRQAVVRRAVEVWRTPPEDFWGSRDRFIDMFQYQWEVLPHAEALAVLHEMVGVAFERPDTQTMFMLDHGAVQITSRREHHLFQIFHVLHHLDPPLAESLIASHEQLAAAARRFPNGIETIKEEAESLRRSAGQTTGGGHYMVGVPGDFPYMQALMQASEDGDFGPAFEHALQRYRKDIDVQHPNSSAREFWPSTWAFRGVLYRAGKRIGRDAAAYLDRIPDADQ